MTVLTLGIDLGTSSVKSVLLALDEATGTQRVIGEASHRLTVQRPQPGWSEQDPETWWTGTRATLASLAAAHPDAMRSVRGIGLSGQMHGAVLLDAHQTVLRPAILWNDVRSAAECRALETDLPSLHRLSGNAAMPGFTAPKLLWVRAHEPGIFARTAHVLLPKDYVRWRLSGALVSDMSDAAGTLWLDVGARAWSDELIGACGMTRAQLPTLVEGSAVSARLDPALAREFGIGSDSGGVAIAGGAGDNAAAACGLGAIAPGSAFLSLGTSGVLFVSTAQFSPNVEGGVHSFCHAVPETWHQMGVILSATDSLEWLARLLETDARSLTEAVGQVGAPARALFLPYLSGERTPHNDGALRGAFAGLGHEADRVAMTQAVLEGVGFAFRDCLRVLGDAGTTVTAASIVGGGANSRVWVSILASILGIPLARPRDAGLGAAFGAARLGLAAATGAAPGSICTPPDIAETIDPDPALARAYDDSYARYRALHPALKDIAPR